MIFKYLSILLILFFSLLRAQNALVFNGAYLVQNGGVIATTKSYIVINEASTTGIIQKSAGSSGGGIISENQAHYIRWINGATATGSFAIPYFTASAASYIPFTLTKATGAANMDVSTWPSASNNTPYAQTNVYYTGPASYTSGQLNGNSDPIDRWWDVSNASVNTGTLTFNYLGAENTSSITSTLYAWRYDNSSIASVYAWNSNPHLTGQTGSTAAGPHSATTSTTHRLSAFWLLVGGNTVLNNELVNFETKCLNNSTEIKFAFDKMPLGMSCVIEKSIDGYNFMPIQQLNLFSGITNYSYLDNGSQGDTYYRLSIVDPNSRGLYYSSVINTNCKEQKKKDQFVYYNQNNSVTYNFQNVPLGKIKLNIYDAIGKLIFQVNEEIKENVNQLNFDISSVSTGAYVIQVEHENSEYNYSTKFIK